MNGPSPLIPQRPALYCRLSYAPDGSLEKVERQEADGRTIGARMNWPEFCCIYVDNSRSAWQRNRRRPDWDRMLRTLDGSGSQLLIGDPKADHQHDGIMTYHGDRLIRQPYDLELLLNLADTRRIPLASVSGVRDLSSPDDRFILRIEAAQACRESDNISRRVRRAVEARVAKKMSPSFGGRRPYGYGVLVGERTKTTIDGREVTRPVHDTTKQVEAEVRFIRGGVQRMLSGLSQNGVVRWLNESGARTTEGNLWTAKAWRNVVLSPRVAGLIKYAGELHPAGWDAAVSVEDWIAIKDLYETNASEHPYQGHARVHLLTGVGECYRCHKPASNGDPVECTGERCSGPHVTVRSKPSGGKGRKVRRIYYCPSCRGIGRNLELLDAYIDGRVLQLLSSPRFADQLHATLSEESAPGIAAEIVELELRRQQTRQQLESLADNPDVDPALALAAVASFDRKITALRSRMTASARLHRVMRLVGISREEWMAESIDTRSAVVADLFRVVILPATWRGPGFSPSSVRLERRALQPR